MAEIYLIQEWDRLSEKHIIGAVSDKAFAERYCRDMRRDGELSVKAITIDELVIPDEKLYRIECGGFLIHTETIPEAYHAFLDMPWDVFVEEEGFMSTTYAALRCLRMQKDSYRGDRLCFWCFAKSARGAITIMRNAINGFDPSVLEWDVYHPTASNSDELKRRIKNYKI